MRAALALLALTIPATTLAQARQQVLNVYTVAQGDAGAESRAVRNRPFFVQPLIPEDNLARGFGIQFDLTPAALDALRDRHDMDDDQPFILAEWIAVAGDGVPAQHLGFLHCSLRLRTFVGVVSACLRDSDNDGRLDGAVTFAPSQFPPGGLQFTAIEPVGYRYARQHSPPPRTPYSMGDALAISYDFARGSGRLRFMVSAPALPLARHTPPTVEVDPARLPATVELGGARLTVLAWDGRRATVRVDRPFPASLVRILTEGSSWRLEYFDLPLPGDAAPAVVP